MYKNIRGNTLHALQIPPPFSPCLLLGSFTAAVLPTVIDPSALVYCWEASLQYFKLSMMSRLGEWSSPRRLRQSSDGKLLKPEQGVHLIICWAFSLSLTKPSGESRGNRPLWTCVNAETPTQHRKHSKNSDLSCQLCLLYQVLNFRFNFCVSYNIEA